MQINRSNYENFFLLYVDGELSTVEMQAVERFALENSDLAAELDALLETRLDADAAEVFFDKEILLRTSSQQINEINYEEQFLLFLDGELTEEENKQTLAFLAAHTYLQPAFDLLASTKLPQEKILFPDKSVLYQKESSKPVAMGWWRMAVAAALIGLVVMVWNLIPTHQPLEPTAKSVNQPTAPTTITDLKTKEYSVNETIASHVKNFHSNIVDTKVNTSTNPDPAPKSNEPAVLPNEEVVANVTEAQIASNINPTNTAGNANNPLQGILDNNNHANALEHATAMPDGSNESATMHQTVYKELDTEDENKSLYLGNLELNRDKLRGFFRKAGNIFKSKIKSEDDRNENANPRSLK